MKEDTQMKRDLDQNCSHGNSTHCGQQAHCTNENCTGRECASDDPVGNCSGHKEAERGGRGQ